ncbi:MAG: Glycosyl transferases group 1 [Candidatus Argoarchaeum ethanivorans]|uniref:Glycosyl transferases group 1 n=1 Tax=Candidatus Argoarchaeum ethanivorans TaxID=2608793 RepID=A0A812A0J5_9EURY|nr:MAG: Glycosyl transferases group 1 [Candidatus Argoarchaeum ethanivorans]
MKKVLLIHQDSILHYRVSIYNYLSQYLMKRNFELEVISNEIEIENPFPVNFNFIKTKLTAVNIFNYVIKKKPDAIILFVNLKNFYLFPVILIAKIYGIKIIYWGHAIDLEDKNNTVKNLIYSFEHKLADAILLYSDNLKMHVNKNLHYKVFVANNTLNTTTYERTIPSREEIFLKYNIKKTRNIICIGRIQKRKRIYDLISAFRIISDIDLGLIIVGSDPDGLLNKIEKGNIYKLGPVYGEDAIKLLKLSYLYCLPGHIGLSIVDAFYCGLPIVTEDVDHAPEIMYFKDGVNGFMVKKGDVNQLAEKLNLLLTDTTLRSKFSKNAKFEIEKYGHISVMCQGFFNVLDFVFQN